MTEELIEVHRWRKWLKEDNLGKRFLITILILISLAFFIHFREVRVGTLELGSTAKDYVVAQVDFEFPDEEGTVILRQESARDINVIYRIDPELVEKKFLDFEKFIIEDQKWRSLFPSVTFEEIYQEADLFKEALLEMRFGDLRTLKRMKSLQLLPPYYYPIPNFFTEETAVLPDKTWEKLQKNLAKKNPDQGPIISYILDHFYLTNWIFDKDTSAQHAIRKEIEDTVPQRYTRIKAGSQIVVQGEKITSRHIEMLQSMKKALDDNSKLLEPLTLLGSFILALILLLIGIAYFRINHKQFLHSIQKISLYATIVILTLILSKGTEYFLLRNSPVFLDILRYPLFIPFAAILLCVLLNMEIAVFTICFLTVIIGFTLAVDHSKFIILNLITGFVALIGTRLLRKRKEVFIICGKVWLTCLPIFFVFSFSKNAFWSPYLFSDLTSSFIFLIFTSILVVGLLPMFESIFHIMTDITLMEYMDPNNELLRRLSVEAPGTYQHCLVVGSIAEAAAQSIGANGLFCRVSTLYHDIGKLFNPHYFTENQMGGFNIHQLLTPLESTQVIIAHVAEGDALAQKYGLPKRFRDVIREHHGTTLVYYFFCKQVEQMGGDVDAVNEKDFRYPGPKPRSRESAIIMMADTVEAASRSLQDVSEASISELVNRIITEKLEDGQFDECQLTFEEFGAIKKTMIKNLAVARHLRIRYPERKIHN